MAELKKAIVKTSNKKVEVYLISSRGTWCDYEDCKTEYQPNELEFI